MSTTIAPKQSFTVERGPYINASGQIQLSDISDTELLQWSGSRRGRGRPSVETEKIFAERDRYIMKRKLRRMAQHFQVPTPKVVIREGIVKDKDCRGGSFYLDSEQTIYLSKCDEHNEDAWIHEFAHHLTHRKPSPVVRRARRADLLERRRFAREHNRDKQMVELFGRTSPDDIVGYHQPPHNKDFFNNLVRVANYWFGDARKYDWEKEYSRIQKWWKAYRMSFGNAAAAEPAERRNLKC